MNTWNSRAAALALALGAPAPATAQAAPAPTDYRLAADAMRNSVGIWVGLAAKDGILREIAVEPWASDWGETFVGATYNRRLTRFWTDFVIDAEIGGGVRRGDTDSVEGWGAFYIRYDGFPWRDRLYTSFGLSTGLHWMNPLPLPETGTAAAPEQNTSQWLHYFSPELTFALPSAPQHEGSVRYAHRSGIFGTFNGVHEGSNVLMVGYRRRF